MADHRLDDLIHTLAQALMQARASGTREHLRRVQARLGRGQSLAVSRYVDGRWQAEDVPLSELVVPHALLSSRLEVRIDCCVEEADEDGASSGGLLLCPCEAPGEHLLTLRLEGAHPLQGELLLDGQHLRRFTVDTDPSAATGEP